MATSAPKTKRNPRSRNRQQTEQLLLDACERKQIGFGGDADAILWRVVCGVKPN